MSALRDALVAEFDQELAGTRRMLERLPDGAFGWQPHPKSMTLGALATHLTEIPRWGLAILDRDAYDFVVDHRGQAAPAPTVAAVLVAFDAHTGAVRQSLVAKSDAELLAPWVLTRGGQVLMTFPRFAALRRLVINHMVHHRGQLSVYLRLQGVPLPPLYGPTADEGM
jgi:uncharacterized damage-inducible protein DinB